MMAPDVELTRDEGSWHFQPLGPELLACERAHRFARDTTVVDVAGPYWFLSLAVTERGAISFRHGDERIGPAKRFAVFIPPYGVVRAEISALHQRMRILISSAPLPPSAPREPVVFDPPTATLPTSLEDVPRFLEGAANLRSVSAAPAPSAVSRRAKASLDAHFRESQSLAALAARLRVPHAVMTRRFKEDFGIAPAKYRTAMRVMDAAMTLLRGEDISATAFRVGFADLGRFYKQFRAVTSATPGRYRLR